MHIFPNNTLAEFSIHLESPLKMETGEWEVGMCEMQFPQSWHNVRRGSNTFEIHYQSPRASGKWTVLEKEVPVGYYSTIPDLIHAILEVYESTNKESIKLSGLQINFNSSTRRVSVNTNNLRLKVRLNGKIRTPKARAAVIVFKGDIARLLGFRDKTSAATRKAIKSDFPSTVSGGFHQMYIYSDIIEPQPHPDGNVPILRTIPIDGKPSNDYLSRRFQKVYYMPVSKQSFSTLQFKILDDTGRPIGFDFGKVLIVLHFRRRSARQD